MSHIHIEGVRKKTETTEFAPINIVFPLFDVVDVERVESGEMIAGSCLPMCPSLHLHFSKRHFLTLDHLSDMLLV